MKDKISNIGRVVLGDEQHNEPFLNFLHSFIRGGVRILSILMVLVIFWGIGDVVWLIIQKLQQPPLFILKINDLLAIFGAFLAVLIAIEIYENITLYLRKDIIHVQLVVATALMAVARKVIVFDYKELKSEYVWASAAVILALGVTYWLISNKNINPVLKMEKERDKEEC